jgi:hypothetical protein
VSYQKLITRRTEANNAEAVTRDGFRVFLGLPDGKVDHLLSLIAIQCGLKSLPWHHNANLGWKIRRILTITHIDDWKTWIRNPLVVACTHR